VNDGSISEIFIELFKIKNKKKEKFQTTFVIIFSRSTKEKILSAKTTVRINMNL
jgi:2-oxo-4-hydroxy-4-carboxy--5-ureidoimidazoline (OHCU) decarboxylase